MDMCQNDKLKPSTLQRQAMIFCYSTHRKIFHIHVYIHARGLQFLKECPGVI